MALTISEDWVRERVKLKHNSLEDVRSLSLPGTYHEKIACLGDSLKSFSRLKALDLSRNAIESLTGFENLKMLEKLSLYYNNVPSLQELYRLRFNQKLEELDLRLNPVARNEPDYRLFLIHLLPSLRRLDDRAVRDNERKAALMHYTTDQATELTEHPPRPSTPPKTVHARVEHVKGLAKPPSAVEEDDALLLDFIAKSQGQRPGSRDAVRQADQYSREDIRYMDRAEFGQEGQSVPQHVLQTAEVAECPQGAGLPLTGDTMGDDFRQRYPHLAAMPVSAAQTQGSPDHPGLHGNRGLLPGDPNLQFTDEAEAYTAYNARGHFTPHPSMGSETGESTQREGAALPAPPPFAAPPTLPQAGSERPFTHTAELYQPSEPQAGLPFPVALGGGVAWQADPGEAVEAGPGVAGQGHSQGQGQGPPREGDHEGVPGQYRELLTKMSDLVDKYWNGAKSLLKNPRFVSQMTTALRDSHVRGETQPLPQAPAPWTETHPPSRAPAEGGETSQLREELRRAREEVATLRERTLTLMEGAQAGGDTLSADDPKMKSTLIRAQRDVSNLRNRLQKSMEENKALQEQLSSAHGGSRDTAAAPTDSQGHKELGTLAEENDKLKQEICAITIRMKQANQMQELAAMLQESHKSLVQTNDHLLKELEETRQRHLVEVKQLHWSYEQLKRTMGVVSGTPGLGWKANGTT